MSKDKLQFYPTSLALALYCWSKFTDKIVTRVLEPSAGAGDLMAPVTLDSWELRQKCEELGISMDRGRDRAELHTRGKWDACELDLARHSHLREEGARIVGIDFMAMENLSVYSHIIMNPPFAVGADHVMHAWEGLYDGEIVAILNAETLRNPFSRVRQELVKVVAQHGEVEFFSDAFKGDDVAREADVEIAIVHLTKKGDGNLNLDGIMEGLSRDSEAKEKLWQPPQELAIPASWIENAVSNFKMAATAAKELAKAAAVSNYYTSRLGDTLANITNAGEGATPSQCSTATAAIRNGYSQTYDELKDRAWASVITSTEVMKKLSSKAQREVESQFSQIKQLEFTAANVHGFLAGLCAKGGEIQMDMVCDLFDQVTRYWSDNTVYYMGWKSNDAHRTVGRRVKMKRFIIPGYSKESYSRSVPYRMSQWLHDFDKTFAILDGKETVDFGLADLFDRYYERLCAGERMKSDYFEVRYYPGRGTTHFFATREDLIDRWNWLVGQFRNWLPPDMDAAPESFRKQYESAEAWNKCIMEKYSLAATAKWGNTYYYHDLSCLGNEHGSRTPAELDEIAAPMLEALAGNLKEKGIDLATMLPDGGDRAPKQLPLLEAA